MWDKPRWDKPSEKRDLSKSGTTNDHPGGYWSNDPWAG